jgi:hypothetical protein
MPLILPGNVASATASTGYDVANSCRFNDGDSADLSLTLGSSLDPRSLYTFSCWIKRGVLSTTQNLFVGTDGTYPTTFSISSADKLVFNDAGQNATFTSDAVLRDSAAWYHLVCRVDTSQASNENRVKFYINGVQATTTQTNTLTQDANISWGKEVAHYVGGRANYFDGYMAEVVWITANSLAPTSFGEFDEDSPTIWKPIDVSELTFGTHGFYLDFEASDNLGNDANGGTDWTENNLAATDQAQDSPTNNWCVLNSLLPANDITLSEGNVYAATTTGSWSSESSTFALTAGKWYFEVKVVGYNHNVIGIQNADNASARAGGYPFEIAGAYGFKCYDGSKTSSAADSASYGNAVSNDQIVGCAIDLDNNKIYWSIDNTWQDSGDPESGATGTGSAFDLATGITYVVCNALNHQTGNALSSFNFGCPSHSNSSDAADGNGYGAFEYAPPSGYLALCSKNLGSDGG